MKKIVFMGTPDFSVPILRSLVEDGYNIALVVTQPDRPKGRKKIMTPPPVKLEAINHNIPVFQPEKLADNYQEIIDLQPDIIVTAAYGQLLPKPLLTKPEFGCINVHASLLPELRGGAPIHHAILQGKTDTGITIMYMVEKLDAGDILTQEKVAITDNDNVGTMHDKLAKTGADLLLNTLPRLFRNEIIPVQQDHEKSTFASNIKREQEIINWNRSNKEIYNQIRGLYPWPVAFTFYQGKPMKIWSAELDNNEYNGVPGEIVDSINKESLVVVCGNKQAVKLTEIQVAGKKRMTVKAFLLGSPDRLQVGTKLGGTLD
ncbi:methionyl-tRNA formyltransferase [Virgibacillus phasianinus]|uniref:Methionyl-tRNA formyltransferase n=1 Tax=Virgibacillus phasianinus TaxID=2017483 RepID=A0A220U5Z4_9BACI|nr:methionyl-tRNA formyltransferase [Virgibacillus phasianinus]ASK63547.1 methionyl-tRNA formyltransferase [Virgibacillus phasianinus]